MALFKTEEGNGHEGMRCQFSNSRESALAVGKCLFEPKKLPGGSSLILVKENQVLNFILLKGKTTHLDTFYSF